MKENLDIDIYALEKMIEVYSIIFLEDNSDLYVKSRIDDLIEAYTLLLNKKNTKTERFSEGPSSSGV